MSTLPTIYAVLVARGEWRWGVQSLGVALNLLVIFKHKAEPSQFPFVVKIQWIESSNKLKSRRLSPMRVNIIPRCLFIIPSFIPSLPSRQLPCVFWSRFNDTRQWVRSSPNTTCIASAKGDSQVYRLNTFLSVAVKASCAEIRFCCLKHIKISCYFYIRTFLTCIWALGVSPPFCSFIRIVAGTRFEGERIADCIVFVVPHLYCLSFPSRDGVIAKQKSCSQQTNENDQHLIFIPKLSYWSHLKENLLII